MARESKQVRFEEIVEVLERHLYAHDDDLDTIREVAAISEMQTFSPDEIIYREQEIAKHLFIVVSGIVDIQYLSLSGHRNTTDTLGPGDFFVWSALVKPHVTHSLAICRSATRLLAIEAEPLRELCEKDTRFGYHVMAQMSRVVSRRLQAARLQRGMVQ